MDWQQVALNGGPPCFALLDDEDGWYCGRAERWEGHNGDHAFVSLDAALAVAREATWDEAIKIALSFDHYMARSVAGEMRNKARAAAHQTGEGE